MRHNLYKWGIDTPGGGGGGQCSTAKKWGRVSLQHMKYVITNGKLHQSLTFDKSMKFCIVVVHGLTNDISYVVKLNRSKILIFLGENSKNSVQKSREIGKYL